MIDVFVRVQDKDIKCKKVIKVLCEHNIFTPLLETMPIPYYVSCHVRYVTRLQLSQAFELLNI